MLVLQFTFVLERHLRTLSVLLSEVVNLFMWSFHLYFLLSSCFIERKIAGIDGALAVMFLHMCRCLHLFVDSDAPEEAHHSFILEKSRSRLCWTFFLVFVKFNEYVKIVGVSDEVEVFV